MNTVAIIPARGGSKGIPAKNLQPIGGVPLVGWAIRAALGAKSISAVYVSTESKAIAAEAREYGAEVIDRPAELAVDTAATLPVVQHVVRQLPAVPDAVAILQCTSPLTSSMDIDCAVEQLAEFDCIQSVVEDHGFLVSRAGLPLNHTVDDRRRRRQDREPQYRVNGSMFVLRTPVPDEWPNRFGLYVMPPERSVDIDHPVDLHVAESLMRYGNAWIICGAGPDAREMLATVRGRYPSATTITTNQGIELFPAPDRPDVYFLTDSCGCRLYHDQAMDAQRRGSRMVTLRREIGPLKDRGLESFDEFVPAGSAKVCNQFVRGMYTAGLTGLLCLQYAINHGAKQVHMVGMNGYIGGSGVDYFESDGPANLGITKRSHTENIIVPFTQSAIDSCPDVEFIVYGRLNYNVSGANARRVVPREELLACV